MCVLACAPCGGISRSAELDKTPSHPPDRQAERQERDGEIDARLDPLEGPEAIRRLVGKVVAAIPLVPGALQGRLCSGGVTADTVGAVPLGNQKATANLPIPSPPGNRRIYIPQRRLFTVRQSTGHATRA